MAPTTRRSNGIVCKPPVRQSVSKDKLIELTPKQNKECMFCGRKEISEMLYGQLYQLNDVIVHYFCILLSSRAVQNGADKDGIWGFLLKDIKAELNRGSREPCFYCNKPGATISCCGFKCRKIFHLPCGLQNGSMHQYFQSFKSFCQQHRITQTIDLTELQHTGPVQCAICKEDTVSTPLPTSIWAPCCKRNAWFHRKCIQELALSAGYFFKCPLCNNVDTFKSRMLTLGIYIPSRDASWETVPNAYAELLARHSTCNADRCLCPHTDRRNFQQDSGSWEIVLCSTCGSNGTHKLCSCLKCDQPWYCKSCLNVTGPLNNKRRRLEISYASSTLNADRSLIQTGLRRNNARGISQSIGIRESRRLNKELLRSSETRFDASMPPRILDSIVISDDDDDDRNSEHDSDIQFIDEPVQQPVEVPSLPVITDVRSVPARADNNVLEFPIRSADESSHQPRDYSAYPISLSIDLTISDDENDV